MWTIGENASKRMRFQTNDGYMWTGPQSDGRGGERVFLALSQAPTQLLHNFVPRCPTARRGEIKKYSHWGPRAQTSRYSPEHPLAHGRVRYVNQLLVLYKRVFLSCLLFARVFFAPTRLKAEMALGTRLYSSFIRPPEPPDPLGAPPFFP